MGIELQTPEEARKGAEQRAKAFDRMFGNSPTFRPAEVGDVRSKRSAEEVDMFDVYLAQRKVQSSDTAETLSKAVEHVVSNILQDDKVDATDFLVDPMLMSRTVNTLAIKANSWVEKTKPKSGAEVLDMVAAEARKFLVNYGKKG